MPAEHPRYANMEFVDNGYMEYPKMVYPAGIDPTVPAKMIKPLRAGQKAKVNQGVVVNNQDEEKLVMEGGFIQREGDEKAELLQRAAILGVQVDKRWGVEKIREKIEDAETALNETA